MPYPRRLLPHGRRPLLLPRGRRPFLVPRALCFPRPSSLPELSGDGGAEPSFPRRRGEGGGATAGRGFPSPHRHRRLIPALAPSRRPYPDRSLPLIGSRSALARRRAAAVPRLPPAQLTSSSEPLQAPPAGESLTSHGGTAQEGRGQQAEDFEYRVARWPDPARQGLATASEPKKTSSRSPPTTHAELRFVFTLRPCPCYSPPLRACNALLEPVQERRGLPTAHTNATTVRSSSVACAIACGGCSTAMLPKLMYTTEPSSTNPSSHAHRSFADTAISPPRTSATSVSSAGGPTACTRTGAPAHRRQHRRGVGGAPP